MTAIRTAPPRELPPLKLTGHPLWQRLPTSLADLGEQAVTGAVDAPTFARRTVEALTVAVAAGEVWEVAVLRPAWDRVVTVIGWTPPVPTDHARDVVARLAAGELDPAEARALLDTPPPVPDEPPLRSSWGIHGRRAATFVEERVTWMVWKRRHDREFTTAELHRNGKRLWEEVLPMLSTLMPKRCTNGNEQAARRAAWVAHGADHSADGWPPKPRP